MADKIATKIATKIPVVITAGGRTTFGDSPIKALITLTDKNKNDQKKSFLEYVLIALRDAPSVGTITIVGPPKELLPLAEQYDATLLPEGKTGIENLRIGLAHISKEAGGGSVLFVASDVPFLTPTAIETLLQSAQEQTEIDILFPVTTKNAFDQVFPDCPGIWNKIADGEVTGGSVFLMRPTAIEKNADLLEKAFSARKSRFQMASLLGIPFIVAFFTQRLTIAAAEKRISEITGCVCRAYRNAPPELACDIDTPQEYAWAQDFFNNQNRGVGDA